MPTYFTDPFGANAAGGPYDVVSSPAAVFVSKIAAVANTPITAPTIASTGLAQVDTSIWSLLGGTDLSRQKGAVTFTVGATYKEIPSSAIPGTIKVLRTSEKYSVKIDLYRTTITELQYVLNGNTLTLVAAAPTVAPTTQINLQQGLFDQQYSLVMLTASPYGPWHSMVYIPRVTNMTGSPIAYSIDDGASVSLTFDSVLETSLTVGSQYGYRIDVTGVHS